MKNLLRRKYLSILLMITLPTWWGAFSQATLGQERSPTKGFMDLLNQAETKTSAKEWDAAATLWQHVVEINPVQVRFWGQLANAYYQARNYRRAIPAYQKLIELRGGYPFNSAYKVAACYALLGERAPALEWLQKAFDMGFRDLEDARTDTDFQSLQDDPRFKETLGIVDMSKMSRDEGWRYDLRFLAREVRRKGYKVFRQMSPAEFDTSVKRLSESIPKLTDMEVVVEMMKLMARVGDGHTGILGSAQRPEFQQMLPMQFYLFKEGLFIIAVDPRYKDVLGAQVLRFGDHTVDEVVRALDPLIQRDNEMWPRQVAPYLMRSMPLLNALGLIPEAQKATLAIRTLGGATTNTVVTTDASQPNIWNVLPNPKTWINVPQTAPGAMPLYVKNMSSNYWFEYLPESKVLYFQYNRVLDDPQDSLAQFSERIFKFIDEHEVNKLVIDMRWNNGGNTFLNQPLLYSLIRNDKVNQRGRLFVIIGRRTFSAAQNAVTLFDRYTNATFVGEPTGSSPNFIGEEAIFTLPYSKLFANVSDLYWQSSWPSDYRTWIAPQIYLPPTFEAYRANRDPVMEAILADQ
jgi:tetratricopeptide (TPR) repeat protein